MGPCPSALLVGPRELLWGGAAGRTHQLVVLLPKKRHHQHDQDAGCSRCWPSGPRHPRQDIAGCVRERYQLPLPVENTTDKVHAHLPPLVALLGYLVRGYMPEGRSQAALFVFSVSVLPSSLSRRIFRSTSARVCAGLGEGC